MKTVSGTDFPAVATELATKILAPQAAASDRDAGFPKRAVKSLAEAGLLGLSVPSKFGGQGQGPRAFANVVATLAAADPSVAMIYIMHTSAVQVLANARPGADVEPTLRAIAQGNHLTTLAFSEAGSRSHFWAPVSQARANGTGVYVTAKKSWVTSASGADSYVVTTKSKAAKGATETTLYLVEAKAKGIKQVAAYQGLGLRANDSGALDFTNVLVPDPRRLTEEGKGFDAKVNVVLPWFNLGCAAASLGICRAAVAATIDHLKAAKFEHLGGATLGEALPTLRARLALMQVETDGLAARVDDLVASLEQPGPATMLKVLETKAAAAEAAVRVTGEGMRICGGAAYSGRTPVERLFRDAHASNVMAPTTDVLHELIGKALLGLPLF